ncbi:hypothetical protein NQ176_g1525 [Zarea fungicola]|uniref:Uncharacterized protein n=1 Tax=Zarea fungicola TaxID=93591 RepID=A0ACC1NT42_9HYPO|nr:hypothetical protein NQ176_g1525 [Lecanicillium fungicola]
MRLSTFSALFILLGGAAAAPAADGSSLRTEGHLLERKELFNILDKKDEDDEWSTTGNPERSVKKREFLNILDKKDEDDAWSTTGNAERNVKKREFLNLLDKKDEDDKWSTTGNAERKV